MNVHLLERHHISVPASTWTDSCCTREVWQGAAGNLRPYADLRPVLSGPLHARKMWHTRRNAEDPVRSSRCELLRAAQFESRPLQCPNVIMPNMPFA